MSSYWLSEHKKEMSKEYSIRVSITETELQELWEGKSFMWYLPVNEDENITINTEIVCREELDEE